MKISSSRTKNASSLSMPRTTPGSAFAPPPAFAEPEEELPEITPDEDERIFHVEQIDDGEWLVEGVAIERAARMTNWDYYEAAMRFQRILKAMGIADALRDAGIAEGDTVQIAEVELIWGYDNAFDE